MEVNNGSQESVLDSTAKKERSAAHPAYNIEDSILFVSEVHKNFRYAFAKRADILSLIKGTHPRLIAAAAYYTLLDRDKDSYRVSENYKKIAFWVTELERSKALLDAFYNPALNKELIQKFDGAVLPKELTTHLSRFHSITEDAAPNAAQVFIDTAKYCGALDDNNILNYNQAVLQLSNPNFKIPESPVKDKLTDQSSVEITNQQQETNTAKIEQGLSQEPLRIPEMVNEEKVRVRLTDNKFAYIIHPLNLNKKDIAVLRKQLDVIEELIT